MNDNKFVTIVIHDEAINADIAKAQNEARERDEAAREFWRKHLDRSIVAESMVVMSLASDAQELLNLGQIDEAIQLLNDLKIVCDLALGARDEHGRHLITGVRHE